MAHTTESTEATEATAGRVASAMRNALQNEALREAVLEFGDARVLLSKGRRLGDRAAEPEPLAEYPDVSTALTDDKDSWLR